MKFEYEIKGITLDMSDMSQIDEYYEAACTAEYILDNYEKVTEEKAMEYGYEIRRLMNKYGYSENGAIQEVLKDLNDITLKVLVSAYCPTLDDVNELSDRFFDEYGYFAEAEDFEEDEYEYDEETKFARFVWVGKSNKLSEDRKNRFIRLTHHAEGLYEDSNIEYTHVEVAIDDIWYGR